MAAFIYKISDEDKSRNIKSKWKPNESHIYAKYKVDEYQIIKFKKLYLYFFWSIQ